MTPGVAPQNSPWEALQDLPERESQLASCVVNLSEEANVFLLWAIPLLLVLVLLVWLFFWRVSRQVRTGERQDGRVLKDE